MQALQAKLPSPEQQVEFVDAACRRAAIGRSPRTLTPTAAWLTGCALRTAMFARPFCKTSDRGSGEVSAPYNLVRMPGTSTELIPHLKDARIVRERRSLLAAGVEVLARASKSKGERFRQTWVCTVEAIDPSDWLPPHRAMQRRTGFTRRTTTRGPNTPAPRRLITND